MRWPLTSTAPGPGAVPLPGHPLRVGFPSHTRLLTDGTNGASGAVNFYAESFAVVLSLSSCPCRLGTPPSGARAPRPGQVKGTPRNSMRVGHVKRTPRNHLRVGASRAHLKQLRGLGMSRAGLTHHMRVGMSIPPLEATSWLACQGKRISKLSSLYSGTNGPTALHTEYAKQRS